jgi:hypothetical protein
MDEDGNQAGNQAGAADAEARISELTGEIRNLKALLDQRQAVENQQREQYEAQLAAQQANQGVDYNSEEVQTWAPWLAPKIAPFLAERDRVIVALADKLDELDTVRKFPEYNDEEFQSRVTKHIRDTKRNRGVVLSRVDAITQIFGQEEVAKRSRGEGGGAERGNQQSAIPRGRMNSPVESSPGIGTTRAASQGPQKDPQDMSIEEFEATFRDMKV